MEWVSDVGTAGWLGEQIDDPWRGTMHDVVPRGYPAYARILHPSVRSRPAGRDWPPFPESEHRRQWERFHADDPVIDEEEISWAETAEALGTILHPLAQWRRLARTQDAAPETDPMDHRGWIYHPPAEGDLPPHTLATLAGVLVAHTTTPDDGGVAIWEGYGGLVGFTGHGPARTTLTFGSALTLAGMPERSTDEPRHRRFLEAIRRDIFQHPMRKPSWQPGTLSDEISRGPRLDLPNRSYVLFRGGVSIFTDGRWVEEMPWSEDDPFPAQAPNLIWPADQEWVMVSEIDWDSTIVAGSAELVDALLAAPGLEVVEVGPDSRLGWEDDLLNT